MGAANGIRIDGLDEFKATLDGLAQNEANNLMRVTVYAVAQQVAKRAAAGVPVDTGTLRQAIKAKRGRSRQKDKPYADVIIESGKDAKHDAFYWRFVEYGTKTGIREHGFVRKAVEAVRPEIPAIVREQFGKKYEALLKRKAKKAAKNGG
jgi:HK97 gp10 family phage protein